MTSQPRTTPQQAPFGSWTSSLGFDEVVASGSSMTGLIADQDVLFWVQTLPEEDGRASLFRYAEGTVTQVTGAPTRVRSRLNEYGGGAHAARDGFLVWCDDATSQVIMRTPTGEVCPLTPGDPLVRHGDLAIYPQRRLVLAVQEDHRQADDDPSSVRSSIVAISWAAPMPVTRVVVSGADFYTGPRLSDDDCLAWVEWDLPAMPWDSARLLLATMTPDLSGVTEPLLVAGTSAPLDGIGVSHPVWSGDGSLRYMSDESGFTQLMAWSDGLAKPLTTSLHDHDLVPFLAGTYSHIECGDNAILTTRYVDGWAEIVRLTPHGEDVLGRFSAVDSIAWAAGCGYAIVSRPDAPQALIRLDPDQPTVLRQAARTPEHTSQPRSIWAQAPSGMVQGWFYQPMNPAFDGTEGELPPLIVRAHGGPTARATSAWYANFQFWTSRGIAVLDVNYSGSTGFGRAYRDRLRNAWGITDVQDCQALAERLISEHLVDPGRVAIMGGSAGGFTALRSAVLGDSYSAIISMYGVTDLVALVGGHKFESRYCDSLIGPWPDERQRYRDRSPINNLDRLHTPVLILQGTADPVVPPAHAETMANALRQARVPVAVVYFEGEGHGFSGSAARAGALRAQLSFLAQVWGFTPADELDPIHIENLEVD